jgi:heavy metal sensor kinase
VLNGEPVRVINFFVPEENPQPDTGTNSLTKDKYGFIIQCAENIDDRLDYLERYSLVLSVSILSILVISASGGFLIARKALKPVKEISETIDRISESNLSERIGVENIPTELKALAHSFNRTFNRLERSFNRQKQFAADASHELRTPLSVILSQSEITLRRVRSADDYQKALKAIHQVASLMSEIIRKLLTITRLGTDKEVLKIETIPLNEIVRESVKLLTPVAEERGIVIHNRFTDPISFSGDQALLVELFTNLIDNAIKYNVPQGEITITASRDLPWLVCSITDTGIGIPEEDLERVFDRFYRVDKSRSKRVDGSGLGLSICEEIVKLHGGKIEMKSKPGSGTTVSVYLEVA